MRTDWNEWGSWTTTSLPEPAGAFPSGEVAWAPQWSELEGLTATFAGNAGGQWRGDDGTGGDWTGAMALTASVEGASATVNGTLTLNEDLFGFGEGLNLVLDPITGITGNGFANSGNVRIGGAVIGAGGWNGSAYGAGTHPAGIAGHVYGQITGQGAVRGSYDAQCTNCSNE